MRTSQVYYTIANYHINKDINTFEFSNRVVDELIELLDYYGILFTESDIADIRKKKNKINLDLLLGSCSFGEAVFDIYKKKVLIYDSVMSSDEIWENDFTVADSLVLYGPLNKLQYAKTEEALTHKIRMRIKYLSLVEYKASADSVYNSIDDFNSKKPELTANIREMEKCRMSQFFESKEALLASFMDNYLKAIASSFDPHTNYMSIEEMEQFESSLSEEVFSTGLVLDEVQNGVYIIAGKIPGSAASEMDEVSEGDELLKIKYDEQEIHPACLRHTDLMSLLNGPEPEQITVSLKKKNGGITKVSIKKTLIENINNEIGSLVLDDDGVKVGYASLPSFYQSTGDSASNSSQDVAKQVLDLKAKNIDGLILDLRFNGGGSVQEALSLASLFISGGPLIQEVSRDDRAILKDQDKETIYDGNIIILVNALSASASEMFVSMMHQHKRALIVGNQTYGKASGQLMGPLALPESSEEFGALKLTVYRYYDLTGSTFQLKGFVPDILVADGYPREIFSESFYKYALKNNSLGKKVRVKNKSSQIPADILKDKSISRQKTNPIYKELELLSDSIVTVMKNVKVMPLEVEAFIDATQFEEFDSTRYDYPIGDKFKLEVISGVTQFGTNTDEQLFYNIGSDPTLREAINIMKDWKTLK